MITKSNGIILPAVLAIVCVIGIIATGIVKTTTRFTWLLRAVKQEGYYRQITPVIIDDTNPCQTLTCLDGNLATHLFEKESHRALSLRSFKTLPHWTALKENSTVINCNGVNALKNLGYSSSASCNQRLRSLTENNSNTYLLGNYHSDEVEEISDKKNSKITIVTQGFFKINQLNLTRIENSIIEIFSVGAINIDYLLLTSSKKTTIYLYSALSGIAVNTNNQITFDCSKREASPGLIIPESKKKIIINGTELTLGPHCPFEKDSFYWPASIPISN